MTDQVAILYDNIAENATLTPGSEAGALVADNLKTRKKSQIWRTTGDTSESLTATYSSTTVNCAGFAITNLTTAATLRIQCGSFDSGDVTIAPYQLINQTDFGGNIDANAFNYGGGVYAMMLFAAQASNTQTIFTLKDPANPAGYIDSAFLIIGNAWQPTYNASYGLRFSMRETSQNDRADNGDLITDLGGRYRSLAFSLDYLQASDRTTMNEIIAKNGTSKPVYVFGFPESTDDAEKQSYQIYGNLTNLSDVERWAYNFDRSSIVIEER